MIKNDFDNNWPHCQLLPTIKRVESGMLLLSVGRLTWFGTFSFMRVQAPALYKYWAGLRYLALYSEFTLLRKTDGSKYFSVLTTQKWLSPYQTHTQAFGVSTKKASF